MQQDYLIKQIDQLGRVLGKILANLLGLKNQGIVSETIEIVNCSLKDELGFDFDELLAIPTDNFIETLIFEKAFNNQHLNCLADICFETAELESKQSKQKLLYQRALLLYEYLEKAENIYSLDRHLKMDKLKT